MYSTDGKAKETHRKPKKEVRWRKWEEFMTLMEVVASKPIAEAWEVDIQRRTEATGP